jgi:hypothetical protein
MFWIALVVAAIILFTAILFRTSRRGRIRMLMASGLTMTVRDLEERTSEFRSVVAIDFGFGREFWATRRDDAEISDSAVGRIIADGYCIVGSGGWLKMEARSQRLGVPLFQMGYMDQSDPGA